MLRQIDRSPRISELLRNLSSGLASRLGLPMLVGTVLILVSGLCFTLTVPLLVLIENANAAWLMLCIPLGILHLGLFLGFLGFMLATPLGAEYRGR